MSDLAKYLCFIAMLLTLHTIIIVLLVYDPTPCESETPCPDGRLCPSKWVCCEQGCCAPVTEASRPDLVDSNSDDIPWYLQWPVLFLVGTLGGILICWIWFICCNRPMPGVYMFSFACCVRRPNPEIDSAGSLYAPPQYSRCGSFHQAPPPYSEVQSKPDLYPLVITCAGDEGDGKSGGNYLMVHYFRNYVIRASGSLSATSTAESLNSSFICNAANEANSIIPPPYSCASNYQECNGVGYGRSMLRSLSSLTEPRASAAPAPSPAPPRSSTAPAPAPPRPRAAPAPARRDPPATAAFRENLVTSPVQSLDPSYDLDLELMECDMYCDGACKPKLGTSPVRSPSNLDNTVYDHEAYGLRHIYACPSLEIRGTCESPPLPTSPTQTSGDSTLRRPSGDKRQRRLDSAKRSLKSRKSSLYMPLSAALPARPSRISPGTRASSRSAPATPCSGLVPNLLNFTQRVSASRHSSKSKFEEEQNPLLVDIEQASTEYKF